MLSPSALKSFKWNNLNNQHLYFKKPQAKNVGNRNIYRLHRLTSHYLLEKLALCTTAGRLTSCTWFFGDTIPLLLLYFFTGRSKTVCEWTSEQTRCLNANTTSMRSSYSCEVAVKIQVCSSFSGFVGLKGIHVKSLISVFVFLLGH